MIFNIHMNMCNYHITLCTIIFRRDHAWPSQTRRAATIPDSTMRLVTATVAVLALLAVVT